MNFRKRKLHLSPALLLTMKELKETLGAGKKNDVLDHDHCYNCDVLCEITCAIYMHE